MKTFRYYLRIFLVGFIFAALVLGSVALKATHPETPDRQKCHPFGTGKCEPSKTETCQPDYQPIQPECDRTAYNHPLIARCPQTRIPCPLDAAEQGTTLQSGEHSHEK